MIRRAFMRMVVGLIGGGLLSQRRVPDTPRKLVLRGMVSRKSLKQWHSACFTRNNRQCRGFAPNTIFMVKWTAQPINDDTFELECHLKPYAPIRIVDVSGRQSPYHVHGNADWPSLDGFMEVSAAV